MPIQGVETKCFEETHPVKWSYCVNTVKGSANQDVIYHFHGRNGDATWWNDETYYTGDLVRFWRKDNKALPTVVAVSFGKFWFLTERKDQADRGLYSIFLQHVVGTIESKLGHPVGRRSLVGESMGGVNALMVALKSGKTFSKVASLCPPLPTVSPFAGWREKYRYIRESRTSWKRAFMMLFYVGRIYPNKATWENNDPVQLSARYNPADAPALYLSCGRDDEWGCLSGSKKVVEAILAKGGQVEWHEGPGGHCDHSDNQSLAAFLVE